MLRVEQPSQLFRDLQLTAGLEIGVHHMAARIKAGVGEHGQQRSVIDAGLIIKLMPAGAFTVSVGGDEQPEFRPVAAAFGEGEGIGRKMTDSGTGVVLLGIGAIANRALERSGLGWFVHNDRAAPRQPVQFTITEKPEAA